MSMIHEGETQFETDVAIKRILEKVIREKGPTVPRIARFAQVLDEVYCSVRTPKPKKPKPPKKPPLRVDGSAPPEIDAESEQAAEQLKPPHLIMCKWIKPPPSVQAHLVGAKLGKGQAQFLEVRGDLWALASDRDKEAAIMTKILEREIVDLEDGGFKVRRAVLPVQTHPAVVEAYGQWWEHMDPET